MKKIFLKIVIGVVLVCILFVCFLYTNNEIGVTSSKLEADIRSSQKIKDDWTVDGSVSSTMAAYISYEAQLLSRQVYVKNRIKTMNESIYYNVDEIHTGIAQNKKIRFRYFDYTVSKERHFRRDNGFYIVSPFALTWDDENYYMVAFDSEAGIIKHFRVDKMIDIETIDEPRDGKDAYDALDMAVYARKVFGMFSGEEQRVRMRFDNQLVGAVLDRLGRDVMLIPDGDSHFTVTADVVVSPQFFAWVCGFRSLAQIIGPEDVVQKIREHVADVMAMYN